MFDKSRISVLALSGAISCIALVAGCSSSGGAGGGSVAASAPPSSSPPESASAHGSAGPATALPSDVRAAGTLVFATNATFKPYEYYPEGSTTLTGMDIDLANAIGQVLGLKVKFNNVSFDGIVAGVSSGQYELAISMIGDTKAREGTVEFVDYAQDTTSLVTIAGNPKHININDMCGFTIGAEAGSTQATQILPDLSKKCTEAGKSAINVKTYPGGAASNLAVVTGRADGLIVSTGQAETVVKNSADKLELEPQRILPKPYGIIVKKDSPLVKPLQQALSVLKEDGRYGQILDKWDQSEMKVDSFELNGALY